MRCADAALDPGPLQWETLLKYRYYLKYTVEWTPDTELVDTVYMSNARAGPETTEVRAKRKTKKGCDISFDVPETPTRSGLFRASYMRLAPFDLEVVAVVGHL